MSDVLSCRCESVRLDCVCLIQFCWICFLFFNIFGSKCFGSLWFDVFVAVCSLFVVCLIWFISLYGTALGIRVVYFIGSLRVSFVSISFILVHFYFPRLALNCFFVWFGVRSLHSHSHSRARTFFFKSEPQALHPKCHMHVARCEVVFRVLILILLLPLPSPISIAILTSTVSTPALPFSLSLYVSSFSFLLQANQYHFYAWPAPSSTLFVSRLSFLLQSC